MTSMRKITAETPIDVKSIMNSFDQLIELYRSADTKEKMSELIRLFEKESDKVREKYNTLLYRHLGNQQKAMLLLKEEVLYKTQLLQFEQQNPIKAFILELLGWINRAEERLRLSEKHSSFIDRQEKWRKDCARDNQDELALNTVKDQFDKLQVDLQKKLDQIEKISEDKANKEKDNFQSDRPNYRPNFFILPQNPEPLNLNQEVDKDKIAALTS